jgi:hypothetical protein
MQYGDLKACNIISQLRTKVSRTVYLLFAFEKHFTPTFNLVLFLRYSMAFNIQNILNKGKDSLY